MRAPHHAGVALVIGLTLGGSATVLAQRAGNAPDSPRTGAPIDLTGYWVAVVSEDWRHRMTTPRKGDFESVPLNAGSAATPTSQTGAGIRSRSNQGS